VCVCVCVCVRARVRVRVRVCVCMSARTHLVVVLRRSGKRKGENLADKARDVWVPAVLAYYHEDYQRDCERTRRREE